MDLEPTESENQSSERNDARADAAALDLVKQLITLAAGVLALSATFLEKTGAMSVMLLMVLAGSWLALIISVLGGIQAMSAIVKSRLNQNDDWSKGRGKRYATTSKYGFLFGIALFAIFAFILLADSKSHPKTSVPADCCSLVP